MLWPHQLICWLVTSFCRHHFTTSRDSIHLNYAHDAILSRPILSSSLKIVNNLNWIVEPYSLLMAHRVILVVVFALLSQNFGKVVRNYKWYFASLWVVRTLEPYLLQSQFLYSQVVGVLNMFPMPWCLFEPPGETFTSNFLLYSRLADEWTEMFYRN